VFRATLLSMQRGAGDFGKIWSEGQQHEIHKQNEE
jgi:hypothetical protein